jgi:hypothetical protein
MQEINLESIEQAAHQLCKTGAPWHFHILSPSCILNKQHQYALILEDVAGHRSYVNYSDKAQKELGTELAKVLHGQDVVSGTLNQELTPDEQLIVTRAKELSAAHISWHHHVLFPGCIFNTNDTAFTLLLEDPQSKTTLKSMSASEPKAALSIIEPLFYAQNL